jgi:16S rRNA (cytosine967-C5)-methyltransferase
VAELAAVQARLLGAAADLLAPGGVLVYAVCSLEPEEGRDQVARVLDERPELVRDPVEAAELGGLDMLLDGEGALRTLPCHLAEHGGMDGFYAARLVRAA